jgi:hypothetical protein
MVNHETEEVTFPTKEQLKKLPTECIAAYAARNALRVFPLLYWKENVNDQKRFYTASAACIYGAVMCSHSSTITLRSNVRFGLADVNPAASAAAFAAICRYHLRPCS